MRYGRKLYLELVAINKESPLPPDKAGSSSWGFNLLAIFYSNKNDYVKAEVFLKIPVEYVSTKDKESEGYITALSNLGKFYERNDNLKLALEYKTKGLI